MFTKRTLWAHESYIQSSSSDRCRNNKHPHNESRMQIKGLPCNLRRQSQLMAGVKSRRKIGNASVCDSATSRAPSTAATGSAFEEVKCEKLTRGKAPRRQKKQKWSEAERWFVLAVRRENQTYGKEKPPSSSCAITAHISVSTV